jgi:hypothetical protein
MRTHLLGLLAATVLVLPGHAQKRAAATKEPSFPEAVETAKKAFDGKEYGAAISALQAAIRAAQKLQRVAVLAALPQPEGFQIRDEEVRDDDGQSFVASMAALGLTITRHYEQGDDKRIDVEVMANSPVVSMLAMMFANPALVKADGGEIVEYGKHKALLKKSGDNGYELTVLMFDKHVVKATCAAMTAEELLVVFDQAAIDRLEKALGN